MTKKNITNKKRVFWLDLARIVAISMVVISHVGGLFHFRLSQFFGIQGFYWVTLGGLGVTVFIVLSGMVLHLRYKDSPIRFWKYLNKRFKRVFPAYWLSLIVTIALFGITVKSFVWLVLNISGFFAFSGNPWSDYTIPTGWFIGLIFTLYLFYPIFKSAFSKFRPEFVLMALFLIEVLTRFMIGRYIDVYRILDWLPLSRFFEFGLGIYLVERLPAKFYYNNRPRNDSMNYFITWLSELSFPIFLIHYPILFLPQIQSTNILVYIPKFALITFMFSYVILVFDRKIQKISLVKIRQSWRLTRIKTSRILILKLKRGDKSGSI